MDSVERSLYTSLLGIRYIRRRDLHTILPKHAISVSSPSPRLSKTVSLEEKPDGNTQSQLKRAQLSSTSSDSGLVVDGEPEVQVKRHKSDDASESSPKPMEAPVLTTDG